jgi:hypothetical protein
MERRGLKSRFLSTSEKRDVARAAIDVLKLQHPNCIVRVIVADETDDRGVPQYDYTLKPVAQRGDVGGDAE